MKKVCAITCYFMPDYVRSRALRSAVAAGEDADLIVVKNRHTGFLRYPEVIFKIIKVRLTERPDVYLLNFRGQEMLPLVLLLIWPKKIIFDEFIVPLAWATQEGHRNTLRIRVFVALAKLSAPFYRMWLNACDAILTDTLVHAKLSAELSQVPIAKYHVIPVSADESLFKPATKQKKASKEFKVFFYGLKMTPLHGLKYILEAAEKLGAGYPQVKFLIVGGNAITAADIEQAKEHGANVAYEKFIAFEDLPSRIHEADLCLGGPFGNTPQAHRVVTGKTYQFLACGAPTVIGKNEAASYLTDKKDCLMVKQGSAEALAESIAWAYDHPKELARIAESGRNTYETYFSSEVVESKLRDIINSI